MAPDVASEIRRERPAPERAGFARDLTTLPNLLSLARILLILAGAGLYLAGPRKLGLALGVTAGVTDIFDGIVARWLGQVTELGAILDRLSDLVLEGSALIVVVLLGLGSPAYLFAYLLREFVVLSARLDVARRGGDVPSSLFGKLKTDCFGVGFTLMLTAYAEVFSHEATNDVLFTLGYAGMVGGIVFSYVSGIQYLRAFASTYTASERGHRDVGDGQ